VSVTAAAGFRAAGVAAGIKSDGQLDCAVVATVSGQPVVAAGCFTTHATPAAPVVVSRRHLAQSRQRVAGVVVNSGNANAATGPAGEEEAERTAGALAGLLGVAPEEVLVCSTGIIGVPLPPGRVAAALPSAVAGLDGGPEAARRAASAILTTDTHPKEVVVAGEGYVIGGMAKGAAMLSPRFATMLAVLTTDAVIDAAELADALQAAVASSFGRLSVDGCQSTNDTVLCLASGQGRPADSTFPAALRRACQHLARQMALDAEGATRLVVSRAVGAATPEDAERAARAVADNALVKAACWGGDPNWGRVVAAVGAAGVRLDPGRLSVRYGARLATGVAGRAPAAEVDPRVIGPGPEAEPREDEVWVDVAAGGIARPRDAGAEVRLATVMGARELLIEVGLGVGEHGAEILSADLSPEYVRMNGTPS
jgi:glutamate N-acetyltransferase/amino-acid N-acetyltransferase